MTETATKPTELAKESSKLGDGLSRRTLIAGATATLAAVARAPSLSAATTEASPAESGQLKKVTAQTDERAHFTMSYNLDYLAYLPEGYSRDFNRKKWPLLLFLHGAGERGSDIELVKVNGPPKLIAAGKTFPFIVISPQWPVGSWWDAPVLEGFIAQIQRRYRIDSTRFYLTGLSMGGYATWNLAVRHPERYAAIVPICGGGDPSQAAVLRDLPAWAFHGARDDVVPVSGSQDMINAIKAAGGNPKFTIYPEAGHDAWTETYANEEVYAWLLQQQRPVLKSSD